MRMKGGKKKLFFFFPLPEEKNAEDKKKMDMSAVAAPALSKSKIVPGGTYWLHLPKNNKWVTVKVVGRDKQNTDKQRWVVERTDTKKRYDKVSTGLLKPLQSWSKKKDKSASPSRKERKKKRKKKKKNSASSSASSSASASSASASSASSASASPASPKPKKRIVPQMTDGGKQPAPNKRYDEFEDKYRTKEEFIFKYGEEGKQYWKDSPVEKCPAGCISRKTHNAVVDKLTGGKPVKADQNWKDKGHMQAAIQKAEDVAAREEVAKLKKHYESALKKMGKLPSTSPKAMYFLAKERPHADERRGQKIPVVTSKKTFSEAAEIARASKHKRFIWKNMVYVRDKNWSPTASPPPKTPKSPKSPKGPKAGYESVMVDGKEKFLKICVAPKIRDPNTYRCRSPAKEKSPKAPKTPREGYESVWVDGKEKFLKKCVSPKTRDPVTHRCKSPPKPPKPPKAPKAPKSPKPVKDGYERVTINGKETTRKKCVSPKRRDANGKCVEVRYGADGSGPYTRDEFREEYGDDEAWYWRQAKPK